MEGEIRQFLRGVEMTFSAFFMRGQFSLQFGTFLIDFLIFALNFKDLSFDIHIALSQYESSPCVLTHCFIPRYRTRIPAFACKERPRRNISSAELVSDHIWLTGTPMFTICAHNSVAFQPRTRDFSRFH
jgi:hypothetical protein